MVGFYQSERVAFERSGAENNSAGRVWGRNWREVACEIGAGGAICGATPPALKSARRRPKWRFAFQGGHGGDVLAAALQIEPAVTFKGELAAALILDC